MKKTCNSCHETKDLVEFSLAKTCVDGHRNYCKACQKLRKDAWRAKNLERHNEKCRRWAEENREKRRAACKKYNQKYILSGRSAAASRKWRANNLIRANSQVNARRRKLRLAQPKWASIKDIRRVYVRAQELRLTVDHIIPISHSLVCGLHVAENLQLLPASENYAKGNTFS